MAMMAHFAILLGLAPSHLIAEASIASYDAAGVIDKQRRPRFAVGIVWSEVVA
jgi:hypothetical protein